MMVVSIPIHARAKNELVRLHGSEQQMIDAIRKVGNVSEKTAKRILEAYPRGEGLAVASTNALIRLGATEKQAERIHGAFALSRLCDEACQARLRKMKIRAPEDVASFVRGLIGRQEREHFLVLLLDARQRVIEAEVIHIGSLAQVDVHPREIFRPAVRLGAHSIILAHNHPSGDADPSDADIHLTQRMVDVGKTQGIPVLDHVVVTPLRSSSLAALGLVPQS